MTAIEWREYTLFCDGEGCTAQFGPLGREMPRAKLRELAAECGWTHVRGRYGRSYGLDYCRAHKPETSTR